MSRSDRHSAMRASPDLRRETKKKLETLLQARVKLDERIGKVLGRFRVKLQREANVKLRKLAVKDLLPLDERSEALPGHPGLDHWNCLYCDEPIGREAYLSSSGPIDFDILEGGKSVKGDGRGLHVDWSAWIHMHRRCASEELLAAVKRDREFDV